MANYLISIEFCLIYLKLCMIFEDDIVEFCKSLAFIVKESRIQKFYQLFIFLLFMAISQMYIVSIDPIIVSHPEWILNYMKHRATWAPDQQAKYYPNIGHTVSFELTYNILTLTGVNFGIAYAMEYINIINWVNSNLA